MTGRTTVFIAVVVLFVVGAGSLYFRNSQLAEQQFLIDLETQRLTTQGYAMGLAKADDDFSNGIYRLRKYGLAVVTPMDRYLTTNYGVRVEQSGCVVTPQNKGHLDGYNSRMIELLNKKYGTDILREGRSAYLGRRSTNMTSDQIVSDDCQHVVAP